MAPINRPIDFGPLRQRNIFGGDMYRTPPFVPEPSPTFPTGPVAAEAPIMDPTQPVEPMDAGIDLSQLYQPETAASQRFEQLMNQMPVREKPGKLRKLGASLIAIKNPKLAEHFMYAPFEHGMEDWKEKMGPAYQAAGLERQENIQRRILTGESVRARQAERKIDIQEKRANVYALKQQNPNMKIFTPKGGNVQVFDPATGELKDTGIPSGTLTEADKIALGSEERIKQIKEQGTQRTMNIAAKAEADAENQNWTDYTLPGGRMIQVNPDTGEAREVKGVTGAQKPTTPAKSGAASSPSQQQTSFINKAQQFKIANPKLARWIQIKGRQVTITPPASGMFGKGPTEQEYAQIQKALIGSEQVVQQQPGLPIPDNTALPLPGKNPPPARPGHIKIRLNGKTGDWPKDKPLPIGAEIVYRD